MKQYKVSEMKYKEMKRLNKRTESQPRDHIKQCNTLEVRVPKERRQIGVEKIFEELAAGNFPNLMTNINSQIEEGQPPRIISKEKKH